MNVRRSQHWQPKCRSFATAQTASSLPIAWFGEEVGGVARRDAWYNWDRSYLQYLLWDDDKGSLPRGQALHSGQDQDKKSDKLCSKSFSLFQRLWHNEANLQEAKRWNRRQIPSLACNVCQKPTYKSGKSAVLIWPLLLFDAIHFIPLILLL